MLLAFWLTDPNSSLRVSASPFFFFFFSLSPMALSSTAPFPNFLCLSLPFSLQCLLIFFFFLCSPFRVTYICSLLKNHYREMVLGSCYVATTVKFCLDFKIFSILCWNLCVNCWTNIVGNFSFSVVLICWTTLSLLLYCFFFLTMSLENRPKSTETKILSKSMVSTILVGFGWEFHKPKYSVSVGHTPTKPTEPNKAHPYPEGSQVGQSTVMGLLWSWDYLWKWGESF